MTGPLAAAKRDRSSFWLFASRWLLTGVVVTATAWLGLWTGRGAGRVPAIWWANAVLLAICLHEPRQRRVPLLLAGYLGNVLAHLALSDPFDQAFLLSLCDVGESAFALAAIQWGVPESNRVAPMKAALQPTLLGLDLAERGRLLRFIVFAVGIGPLLSATLAAAMLHDLAGADLGLALRWFPPSALGMAIVTPLLLGLARPETKELFAPQRLFKTLACLGPLAAATVAIFSTRQFPWLFLLFPPLILLAVELGVGGGALGAAVVAAVGSIYTVSGRGLMSAQDGTLEHRILILQLFLATAVLSVNLVGLVLGDLKRTLAVADEAQADLHSALTQLEEVARLDATTRVANRRHFDEKLDDEWQRASRQGTELSLLLFDIDYFKRYNDLYGHVAGDDCLRRVAALAGSLLKRPGDLLARYGGEEFGVILPETNALGAREVAESLCRCIRHELIPHEGSPEKLLTISVGCATVVPLRGGDLVTLVQASDLALYQAKHRGRNRVFSSGSLYRG